MADRTCSIDGCARRHQARGLCQAHYSKAARAAAATSTPMPNLAPRTIARVCEQCGEDFMAPRSQTRFCSLACRDDWRRATGNNPFPPPRSALQRLLRESDWPGLLLEIQRMAKSDERGCWLWPSVDSGGYPVVRSDGRRQRVHRVSFMAAHAGSLADEMTVHHKCAVRRCVNPDHLEQATNRANIAEMFERKYYRARIAALEDALRGLNPRHELLG